MILVHKCSNLSRKILQLLYLYQLSFIHLAPYIITPFTTIHEQLSSNKQLYLFCKNEETGTKVTCMCYCVAKASFVWHTFRNTTGWVTICTTKTTPDTKRLHHLFFYLSNSGNIEKSFIKWQDVRFRPLDKTIDIQNPATSVKWSS